MEYAFEHYRWKLRYIKYQLLSLLLLLLSLLLLLLLHKQIYEALRMVYGRSLKRNAYQT